ncbi:MAG TPA: TetR family transcriptional regulator C-terminal domain-containing protein [Streptosporangiaceae bacterium]|jgi:AcrR family transcriptional regulator
MPRTVDAGQRRTAIAEAVWRVIRRDGLEHASVRGVAAEAGLSMGSLRHWFGTQSELLAFAMRMVIDRIIDRVRECPASDDARAFVERVLGELLPLDDDRRAESEVWLAFVARALADPDLRVLAAESDERLREACGMLLDVLARDGQFDTARDRAVETERLYALVDGLLVHAVITPGRGTAPRMRAVLARHLDDLRPPG